jgi:N-acetylmuramoyl-L-alanine amidase
MKTANFKILKNINCPGIVFEIGFLSNKEDKNKLNSAVYQQRIAKAIYDGLLKASKIRI